MKITKMAKGISLAVIIMFLLEVIFGDKLLPLVLTSNIEHYHSYQLITHMFLHKDIMHLFTNLILLIVASREVERFYNDSSKYLTLYFTSGILAALSQILAYAGEPISLIGASGSIFGVLGASLIINPYQKISIFKFKIPFLIIGLLLIIPEIVSCIEYASDGVGHFAHIGGLLTGIVFYFFNRK